MFVAKHVIFETKYWTVFLNVDDQTNLGRSFVSCKRAAASLSDLTDEEWQDFHVVVKRHCFTYWLAFCF